MLLRRFDGLARSLRMVSEACGDARGASLRPFVVVPRLRSAEASASTSSSSASSSVVVGQKRPLSEVDHARKQHEAAAWMPLRLAVKLHASMEEADRKLRLLEGRGGRQEGDEGSGGGGRGVGVKGGGSDGGSGAVAKHNGVVTSLVACIEDGIKEGLPFRT